MRIGRERVGGTVGVRDPRRQRMTALEAQIRACRRCEGMNIPGETKAAPGYGSVRSPVVMVGQSLCRECMESQIPFTGGGGRFLDDSFDIAGIAKHQIFITNVVHCHPPGDRKSLPDEIMNCTPYLHRELEIVQPSLIIGLGLDAKAALRSAYPEARELPWPFTVPLDHGAEATAFPDLLFAPHPSSIRWKPKDIREEYVTSLARALEWGFRNRPQPGR